MTSAVRSDIILRAGGAAYFHPRRGMPFRITAASSIEPIFHSNSAS
ncbi:hypothetical protein D8I24_4915 [Cupriavidus necator H850]|jgi:hypothetical protein|nr:hypothetical protein D8I24_4915 [Cupriavidus necator H850]